jgi:hypothetical protein
MKAKTFWMEMLIRDGEGANHTHEHRNDSHGICVPVYYVWQESPEDLHIQIRDGGDNLLPWYSDKCGDYIVPNPYAYGGPLARCYHISFSANPVLGLGKADDDYLRRLEEVWPSPNYPEWPGGKEVKNYERKIAAYVKQGRSK